MRQAAPLRTPSSFQRHTKNKRGQPTRDTLQSPCASESTSRGRDPHLRTDLKHVGRHSRSMWVQDGPPGGARAGAGRPHYPSSQLHQAPASCKNRARQLAPGEEAGGGDEGSSQSGAVKGKVAALAPAPLCARLTRPLQPQVSEPWPGHKPLCAWPRDAPAPAPAPAWRALPETPPVATVVPIEASTLSTENGPSSGPREPGPQTLRSRRVSGASPAARPPTLPRAHFH